MADLSDRQIHISRGGEQYGPYPELNAREMLAAGQLQPTDMAWYAGADEWKPLKDVFVADSPPSVPAEPAAADQSGPPDEEPDDPEKIHVTRRGEPIGPYSRDKAMEYFIAGQLLPTDWGWHDGMDEDWKPLNDVLGLSAPVPMGTGKGKKIAKIGGLAVVFIGLIAAGILYGPKLLGGGKIDTPEELAEQAVKAFSKKDFEAFKVLTAAAWSEEDYEKFVDEFVSNMTEEGVQKFQKLQSAFGQDEIPVEEMRQKKKEDMLKGF